MVECDIEQRIVDKIKQLNIKDIGIYGVWGGSSEMLSQEQSDKRAYVVVKVPSRGFDRYGICEVQFDIVMSLVIRLDMCPAGKDIVEITEPIVNMLQGWNLVQSDDELYDFMVEDFYPAGVMVNQGVGPDIDRQKMLWTNTFQITLKGTVGCGCQHE